MTLDVDRALQDEVRRAVEEQPGRPTGVVPLQRAAWRIRDVVRDAPLGECPRVDQRVMAGYVEDDHGVIARRFVEVPARRPAALAELRPVHPEAANPAARRRPLGGVVDEGDELLDRSGRSGPGIDREECLRRAGEVVVGIDEAGNDRPAGQVDEVGVGLDGLPHLRLFADRRDPAAPDGDRGRPRASRIARHDPPVPEHDRRTGFSHRHHLAHRTSRGTSVPCAEAGSRGARGPRRAADAAAHDRRRTP